jgi:hypothetical protein
MKKEVHVVLSAALDIILIVGKSTVVVPNMVVLQDRRGRDVR